MARTLKWAFFVILGMVGGYGFLLTLCVSVSLMKAGRWWVREWTEPPLPMEGPVTLHIRHSVGQIYLRATDTDTITVRVRAEVRTWWPSTARRFLEAMDVRIHQQGNEVFIEDVMPSTPGVQTKNLDLDITVPRHTAVMLVHEVGRVVLEDVRGLVRLDVDVGEVRLRDVSLGEGSRIAVKVGQVRFEGALPQKGWVEMRTEVGELALDLQSEYPFHVQAEADVGKIAFRCPSGQRIQGKGHLELDVGSSPSLQLVLKTGTGAIHVRCQELSILGESAGDG